MEDEIPSFREREVRVDYEGVRAFKAPYLRQAYQVFQKKNGTETDEYKEFVSMEWVYEYGVFKAMKASNDGTCWNEWSREEKDWPKTRTPLPKEIEEEAAYQMFLQYIFYTQWMKVKDAANSCGIQIMGDVPFYVGVDSVDVWAGKDNFLLDEDGYPTFIAGVPPDYFSSTGQRWGNPIYDWEYMAKNGCRIGGEQSGHIIFSKYASTGDGILTSLKMMEVMLAKKKPMSELAAPLKIYPQVLENVSVTDKKAAQNDLAVQEAVNTVAEALGDTGRILVRESGTEPVVRVMVEAPDHDTCQKYVNEVVNVICEKGYKA